MNVTDKHIRDKVLFDILIERKKQDEKYGEHNRRTSAQMLSTLPCERYGLPSEEVIKSHTDEAMEVGKLTFAHVATEELIEAISAKDEVNQREELIQCAASIVQWIEAIDRKNSKSVN